MSCQSSSCNCDPCNCDPCNCTSSTSSSCNLTNIMSIINDLQNRVIELESKLTCNEEIELVVEGSTMKEIHEKTVKNISQSLIDLGLVPKGLDETISMMHYFEFFMHGTGHWLGLDVHDAGSIEKEGSPRELKEGMVTTVEPGIYIRPSKPVVDFPLIERDPLEIKERSQNIGIKEAMKAEKEEVENAKKLSHKIPENLLGIGVRIEDDIVCTKDNPINLTKEVPREVQEVEDICSF